MKPLTKICTLLLTFAIFVGQLAFSASAGAYTDVSADDKALCEAVELVSNLGVIKGSSETTFSPDSLVNRAQMAAFIYRFMHAGETVLGGTNETPYTDLDDETFYSMISWVYDTGIIKGKSETTFDPYGNVMLQDAYVYLVRALGYEKNGALTYPFGYISVAESIGIGENLPSSLGYNDQITKGNLAIILANAFYAEMYDGGTVAENVFKVTTSGTCGTNLTWTLYDDGELVIEGTGEMTNWSDYTNVPWYYHSSSIKKVTIENSVTTIGDYAFYFCENLAGIDIHDAVTHIGDFAFYNCWNLTKVDIPDGLTSIGVRAFAFCSALESADIPDNVTSIGEYAFSYTGLKTVNIPGSVTSIGEQAFFCYGFEKITVDSNNAYYSSDERGVLFDKNKTTLVAYPPNNAATTYTIPDSVKTIGVFAFFANNNLVSIDIPDSVKTIGNDAFRDSSSLKSITFTKSVTTIGDWSLYNCSSLSSVTVYNKSATFGRYIMTSSAYSDITLYGYAGSTTETYATQNNIPFVALKETLYGDVNGDGVVNRLDLLRLGKRFSGWEVEIDENASDVTGDGDVNRLDLLRLGKCFSGWEVVLGK